MIKIYRFGRYVNKVEDEKQLRRWILDNVLYTKNDMCVPEGFTLSTCMEIARERNYSFEENKDMDIKHETIARLSNVLNYARFPEVAQDLIPLHKRGLYYMGRCPHCHENGMVINTHHNIYKCWGCGETGNVVNFVMAERNLSYADALNYLESKYCNN